MLIPSRETVDDLIWTDEAAQLAEIFWPGSVTLILSDPEAHFPPGVRGESGAVAVLVDPGMSFVIHSSSYSIARSYLLLATCFLLFLVHVVHVARSRSSGGGGGGGGAGAWGRG